jgi:hypothetical protein
VEETGVEMSNMGQFVAEDGSTFLSTMENKACIFRHDDVRNKQRAEGSKL